MATSEVQNEQGQPTDNKWVEEGGWYVWRERTTRPFPHIRTDATRLLYRGLAALSTVHEWRGRVLHVQSVGCNGTVGLEGGSLVTRIRFDMWGPVSFIPSLKKKILSEVGAATVEAAGGNFYGKEVFIIHGHDLNARAQLKELLSSFGLTPIVLAEQSGSGMTIIEKFEEWASACSFAFALMTPDDLMELGPGESSPPTWRARANVNLELGWFMARLGRSRVMILLKGRIEMPSDLAGILYLSFKDSVMEIAPQISHMLRQAGLI